MASGVTVTTDSPLASDAIMMKDVILASGYWLRIGSIVASRIAIED